MAASRRGCRSQASTSATAGDPIAVAAVNAAKKYCGQRSRSSDRRVGLQALDAKNFSGPLWEKLTGIKINVDRGAVRRRSTRRRSPSTSPSPARSTSSTASPAWMPDFADRGVIAPIDSYISKYKAQSTFNDYHPLYRALCKYKGKTWGFFDDGDVWTLYYRKDIFANAKLKAAYKAKFKRDLRVAAVLGRVQPRPRSSSPTRWRRRSMAAAGPRRSATRQPVLLLPAVPRERRPVLRPEDDEGADQQRDRRQDDAADHARDQGVSRPASRSSTPSLWVTLAPGQDGDDLLLAADRPHRRELRPARQGVLVPAEVEDRRQGRLRGHARQERRACRRLRQVRVGRLEEPGGWRTSSTSGRPARRSRSSA